MKDLVAGIKRWGRSGVESQTAKHTIDYRCKSGVMISISSRAFTTRVLPKDAGKCRLLPVIR